MSESGGLGVGIFLSTFGVLRGGLETTVAHLATGLGQHGHSVTLVSGRQRRGNSLVEQDENDLERLSVPCIPANHPRWSRIAAKHPGWPLQAQSLSFMGACHARPEIARQLATWDVTITALEIESVLVSRWRERLHRPNLSLFPGIINRHWLRRDRSNVRIAVSHGVAERMRNEPEVSIDGVLLSGAPEEWLELPYTVRRTVRTLLFVGRLEPNKGVLDLLSCFEPLARELPGLRLRIVGEGPQERPVRERIERAGLNQRVECLGAISHDRVHQELRDADLFILPSHYESFSQALLEAAAVGVPVVASDILGNQEAAGDSACLLPLADTALWIRSIRELVADHSRRQRMSAAGRRRARRLTSFRATQQLEGYLHLALERAAARPL